jgi:hypothetical protein
LRIIADTVRVDAARSGTSMQMTMILCRLLGHFGMHDVFGGIAKQRRAAIIAKLWRENGIDLLDACHPSLS